MTPEQYKQLSIREFTKAVKIYETDPFDSLLDVGCGTGPVVELLAKKYPEKHFIGLDITPAMIEVAQSKGLSNAEFMVGDAENLPFGDGRFDAVLCSNSFHHYPNPGAFLREAHRVLRPGGKLILRDYTSNDVVVWLMNTFELPLARLAGHGDVRILKMREYRELVEAASFKIEKLAVQKGFRAHMVAKK